MRSSSFEVKTLTAIEPIENFSSISKIASYSSFLGPVGITHSTGRIARRVNTESTTRHNLVRLLTGNLQPKRFHQALDYMHSALNMKYAFLSLKRLLRSIVNQRVTCRKIKPSTIQPFLSKLPVERLGSKQPLFTHLGVDYFGPLYFLKKH